MTEQGFVCNVRCGVSRVAGLRLDDGTVHCVERGACIAALSSRIAAPDNGWHSLLHAALSGVPSYANSSPVFSVNASTDAGRRAGKAPWRLRANVADRIEANGGYNGGSVGAPSCRAGFSPSVD